MPASKPKAPATDTSSQPVAFQLWTDVMSASAQFAIERWNADMAAWQEMSACTSPAELMQAQTKYGQNAAKHYAEYTVRMVDMASRAGLAAPSGMSSLARRSEDVPV